MTYYSTGLSYKGTDLTTSNLRFAFRVVVGLAERPSIRGRDTIIPGLAGRTRRNRLDDVLKIEADGLVRGIGANEDAQQADLRDALNELYILMDPTDGPGDLVATMEDGTTRTISASPVDDAPVMYGPDDIPSYRSGSLKWESIDPAGWVPGGS